MGLEPAIDADAVEGMGAMERPPSRIGTFCDLVLLTDATHLFGAYFGGRVKGRSCVDLFVGCGHFDVGPHIVEKNVDERICSLRRKECI